jgi:hypothetical protein
LNDHDFDTVKKLHIKRAVLVPVEQITLEGEDQVLSLHRSDIKIRLSGYNKIETEYVEAVNDQPRKMKVVVYSLFHDRIIRLQSVGRVEARE